MKLGGLACSECGCSDFRFGSSFFGTVCTSCGCCRALPSGLAIGWIGLRLTVAALIAFSLGLGGLWPILIMYILADLMDLALQEQMAAPILSTRSTNTDPLFDTSFVLRPYRIAISILGAILLMAVQLSTRPDLILFGWLFATTDAEKIINHVAVVWDRRNRRGQTARFPTLFR